MSAPTPHAAAIGIDLGHSSVKIAVKSTNGPLKEATEIFPTVVRNWSYIADTATAKKTEADTVEVEDRKFFVGVTAVRQGQADTFTGQNRNWVNTIQHDALLAGAWQRALNILHKNDQPDPQRIVLVLGLPASYYLEQRKYIRTRADQIIRPRLKVGQTLEIFVQSQSRAPFACVSIDGAGHPTGVGGDTESWGVVEIGHFTTDFTFHDRGQEVESAASSASGAHLVYDNIAANFKQRGYLSDFESVTDAIQRKHIKVYGKDVDVSDTVNAAISQFSTYILDEVTTRFGEKAQRMDGIIVAGGGAAIVGKDIQDRFPNAIIPDAARYAVAEGYSRIGLLRLRHTSGV
jgi:plasmid segregation protein ParM